LQHFLVKITAACKHVATARYELGRNVFMGRAGKFQQLVEEAARRRGPLPLSASRPLRGERHHDTLWRSHWRKAKPAERKGRGGRPGWMKGRGKRLEPDVYWENGSGYEYDNAQGKHVLDSDARRSQRLRYDNEQSAPEAWFRKSGREALPMGATLQRHMLTRKRGGARYRKLRASVRFESSLVAEVEAEEGS
jgi:hypothetical protein